MMLIATLWIAVSLAEAQWPPILACPRVSVPGITSGTGVVIGTKDGFAYLLTAAHVIGDSDAIELAFASRASYPKPTWYPDRVEVLGRWPDPDLALLRFPLGKQGVTAIPPAPPWQRPKTFPAPARSIGFGGDPAIRGEMARAKEFVARDGKQLACFWQTETPPEPGRSGGPLLDARGRVIGIAVAASGGKGYFAHHDEILAAIKRAGQDWLIPKP